MARRIDTQARNEAVRFEEQGGDPAQPAAGYRIVYAKAGGIYEEDDTGAVVGPFGAGGGAPDDVDYWVETSDGGLSNEVVVGTTGITTTTHGARQAAAKAGRLFLPSDSAYLERDTGAAWSAWGPLYPITLPVSTGFAWDNQVDSTLTDVGVWKFYDPLNAGIDIAHYEKNIPAAPWVFTALISICPRAGNNQFGLLLRDSATNKKIVYWAGYVTAPNQSGITSFNVNTGITDYAGPLSFWTDSIVWMRITDNNTDWIYSFSTDSFNFQTLFSHSRNTYMTADKIGFAIMSRNATYPMYGNVLGFTGI